MLRTWSERLLCSSISSAESRSSAHALVSCTSGSRL
nr:unnamed protein product [Callosobruchus analis]